MRLRPPRFPFRPPRFPLVLALLVATAGVAILLLVGGPTSSGTGTSPTIGIGPAHACRIAHARAQVTARSAIIVTATANAPLSVTEQASGPKGVATVTRNRVLSARLKVSQPVGITAIAGAHRRACANAGSQTAAGDRALRQAYAAALSAAHTAAGRNAEHALRALLHRLYPSVLRRARARAAARAHQLAVAGAPALAARARADARRRAGA